MKTTKCPGIIFTDIDGTWHQGNLFLDIQEELVKQHILPGIFLPHLNEAQTAFRNQDDLFYIHAKKLNALLATYIQGVEYTQYVSLIKKVILQRYKHVLRYTNHLIAFKLRHEKWHICAISNSPQEAIKMFTLKHGVKHSYGSSMLVNADGLITGRGETIKPETKTCLVDSHLKTINTDKDTKIWACGDSMGDFPMLLRVHNLGGLAICINPDFQLLKQANKHDWRIVTERNGIITEFQNDQFMVYQLTETGKINWIHYNDNIERTLIGF